MADGVENIAHNMVKEFCEVTEAEPETAKLFIQKNNFILQDAIVDFFDNGAQSIDYIEISDDDFEVNKNHDLCKQNANESSGSKISTLKLITWNIDGLDDQDLKLRTLAVAFQINSLSPDVVFLQEVVPETLELIKKSCKSYIVHHHSRVHYFCAILIKTSPLMQYVSRFVLEYPGSLMGRYLLGIRIRYKGQLLTVMTTHLESTKNESKERQQQLVSCLEEMRNSKKDGHVIFAGDLNIRDYEMDNVGALLGGIHDAWIQTGSNDDTKFTWDVSKNDNLNWTYKSRPKLRFDRVFFASGASSQIKAESFELIGKKRLESCDRFPSDHWGIICEFTMDT